MLHFLVRPISWIMGINSDSVIHLMSQYRYVNVKLQCVTKAQLIQFCHTQFWQPSKMMFVSQNSFKKFLGMKNFRTQNSSHFWVHFEGSTDTPTLLDSGHDLLVGAVAWGARNSRLNSSSLKCFFLLSWGIRWKEKMRACQTKNFQWNSDSSKALPPCSITA